jgi:hypothetical protein
MHLHPLYVVADCSGSMSESGKARVLSYLLAHVAQCVRLRHLPAWCAGVDAIAWTATVQVLPLPLEKDLPQLHPEGRADATALMAALEARKKDSRQPLRILLLSDGGIGHADQKRWQAWRAVFQVDVRAVAVGADASRPALEALAGKGQVFDAEDIGMALHDWYDMHSAPLSFAAMQGRAW